MRVKENVTERNIQQCLNSLVRLKGAAGRCQHQPFTATMLKKYLKKKTEKNVGIMAVRNGRAMS